MTKSLLKIVAHFYIDSDICSFMKRTPAIKQSINLLICMYDKYHG